MDIENDTDSEDLELLDFVTTAVAMQPPSDINAPRFTKPPIPSRDKQSITRGRCRSNDSGFVQPRWTPYPKSSGSCSTPLRTEYGSSQASLPPSSGTYSSFDLDGFEIAPATASKLERYRFTPSPVKAIPVLPLPSPPSMDFTDGNVESPIDLTEAVDSAIETSNCSQGSRKDASKWSLSTLPHQTSMDVDPYTSIDDPSSPSDYSEKASLAASTTKLEKPPSDPAIGITKGFANQDERMGMETKVEHAPQMQKVEETETLLSEEQQRVLNMVIQGESLFFTGSAGTGKSFLLKEIIRRLRMPSMRLEKRQLVASKRVAVTASTGIAGVNIGGTTLHSWAGIGLGMGEPAVLAARMRRDDAKRGKMAQTAFKRWRETEVLIIDEISMIDGRFWDKLEELARYVRSNNEPFGGIQLVLCGDFFQLPPVPDRHDRTSVFAFQARTWHNCVQKIVTLTQVFRQKAGSFVQMLNEARTGILSPSSTRKFAMLDRPIVYHDGIDATELYPIKRQAEDANQRRLRALSGEISMYVAIDVPGHKSEGTIHNHADAVKLLDQYCKAPAVLELKVGCQVMLITNINGGQGGLCNGSLGRIIAFETETSIASKQELGVEADGAVKIELTEEEKAKAEKKAQKEAETFDPSGWDTDEDEVDAPTRAEAEEAKEPQPKADSKDLFKQGDSVTRRDADKKGNRWPLVEFTNGQTVLVKPFDFELLTAKGTMEAKRVQVPLILSYALSVHKAQGITLPRMKVDLRQTFEKGQAYVALSRATSTDTLEVRNFHPSKVFAHPTVIQWAKNLQSVV